ncbi:hypothetical protein fugu_016328 [Takifugu bimaculatus]|uniref:Phosphatidic acid phosphatase type 2/haloperoxidase domain-containing protein n=1 Tax=Takifugu bimaculatus TaxID=433685 RepID=A0A4Z2BSM0_9TELE|nr:hypothetical protein fugu_016328 [Takifugu bimaculatus]
MTEQGKKLLLIAVDILCVFVAALPSAILTLRFSPYQRGIYCDDQSIDYPYRRDTISYGTMAAVTITCSIVIVRHVSDFFKQRPPRCTLADPEENEHLERKPNPQPPDAQHGNHYSYRGAV